MLAIIICRKPDNPPPQQFAPDGTVIPLSECQAVVPFAVTLTPEHFRGIMIRVLVLIYQKITAQSAIALPFHVSQLIEAKLKTAHQHWQSGRAKECSTGIKEASKLICKALGGALVPPAQAKTWAEIIDFLGIPEPSYLECMNMLALLAESTGDDAKKWVVPVHPTTGEAVEWQYQEIQRTSPGQGIWVLDQKHSKQIANLEQSHSEEMTGLKHQHSKEMEDMEERMEQKYSQQMSKMEQRLEQLLALAMAKEGNRTQTATPQATQQEGADGRMRPGHQSQVETERDDQEKTPYESETAGVEECLQGSKEDPKLEQSYKQEPQEEVDQSRSKVQVPSENVGPDSSQKEVVPQSSLEKQDAGETRTEGDVRRHDSQEEHPPLHRNDLQSHKEAQNTEKEEIASPRDQQSEGSVQSVEGSSESLPIPCQNELQREENDHQQKSLEQGKEVQTSSAGRAGPKSSRGEETPSKERKKVDSPPKESSWGQALSYLIPSQLRQIILQEQEHNEEAGLERNEAVRESSLPSSSEPPPTQPDEAQSKDSEQKDNACGESDESSTKPTPKLEKRESQPQGKKEESEDHQEGEVHHKEVESSWGQALSYLIRGSDEPKPKPQIEGESQPQEQREPQPEEKKEESEDHEVHHKEVGSSWGQALSYLIRGSDEPKPKPQIEGESQPQEQREPQPEEKKEESEDHEVHHKEVGSSWGQALSYLIRGSDEPKPKPQIEGESQPQSNENHSQKNGKRSLKIMKYDTRKSSPLGDKL